jgi:hypothetical protein
VRLDRVVAPALSLFTTRSSFDLRFWFSVLSALIVLSRASSGGPGDVLMVTRLDRLARRDGESRPRGKPPVFGGSHIWSRIARLSARVERDVVP